MKETSSDVALAVAMFSVIWSTSVFVLPPFKLALMVDAIVSAFIHIVVLGFIRTDDIESNYSLSRRIRDHAWSLTASGPLFAVVAGLVYLFGRGQQ